MATLTDLLMSPEHNLKTQPWFGFDVAPYLGPGQRVPPATYLVRAQSVLYPGQLPTQLSAVQARQVVEYADRLFEDETAGFAGRAALLPAAVPQAPTPGGDVGGSASILPAVAAGVAGAAVGAAAAVTLRRRRRRKATRRASTRRASRSPSPRRRRRRSRTPARNRRGGAIRDRYRGRRVRVTKHGQPYVILANGKARFVKR